ncbi:hypothetical protein HPHPP2B_0809 [Helicobacter pylori Hp P-2b]|uniref:Uncharacterized protein n=1 Tax=Helicobacter pylori Hp P-2 TaxID=992073 RepID=J0EMC4_HELPX|nr:hypothetical protein HPHPP2_0805 [Helicobacter pylori Hp P-2]EJC58025.1 hypothetical protein HPHPP2B_0809 [Helicobacter pylori Hp P-2b]
MQIFYFFQTTPLKPLDEFLKCLLDGIGFVGYAQKFLLIDLSFLRCENSN